MVIDSSEDKFLVLFDPNVYRSVGMFESFMLSPKLTPARMLTPFVYCLQWKSHVHLTYAHVDTHQTHTHTHHIRVASL